MHIEGYELRGRGDRLTYFFTNAGTSGSYECAIVYSPINIFPKTHNLGFGVIVEVVKDGKKVLELSDTFNTNNDNIRHVMATVASSIWYFWEVYSDQSIFFEGSTPERNMLYRRALSNYGNQLQGFANICGISGKVKFPFRLGTEYDGFLLEPITN